jgi:glycosyltransferase involved in cell wall biosynthesis
MKVSVVVPYRGNVAWLRDAIDSVLRQTLDDLEIVVVDDGSDDVASFVLGPIDPRVQYVRQAHQGASAARNNGLRTAKGKFVAFLDADDLFLPEKLREQVQAMEARPDILLSHTSYRRTDVDGRDLDSVRSGTFTGNVYPGIVRQCPIATPTVMVNREGLLRTGLTFDESIRIGEDTILWMDIARRHEILGIDTVLSKVRIHGGNAYASPEAQYQGGMAIISHAMQHDPQLSPIFRRQSLAEISTSVGRLYEGAGKQQSAARHYMKALMYWPTASRLSVVVRLLLRATTDRFRGKPARATP